MADRPAIVRIGDWRVDAALGELSRDGKTLRLEPRTMRVLIFLAERAGRVVDVQQLLEEIWPNVVVTQGSVYQAVANLRRVLGDDSEHPKYIENIPRRGYRLIAAVQTTDANAEDAAGLVGAPAAAVPDAAPTPKAPPAVVPQPAPEHLPHGSAEAHVTGDVGIAAVPNHGGDRPAHRPARPARTALALTFVAVAGIALGFAWREGRLPGSRRAQDKEVAVTAVAPKSIAVVPFANLTTAPEQRYFADGLTSALIDRLTQFPGLLVIGQTSSEAIKDNKEDVPTLARRLNVSFLVEGTVRGSGDELRVSARLLRAADGFELWSREFQRSGDQILRIQEDIADSLAHNLRVGIDAIPPTRPAPGSLEAYRLLLQAEHLTREQPGTEGVRSLLQAAIQSDPNYAEAWSDVGSWWYDSMYLGRTAPEEAIPHARAAYEHALKLDPNLSEAWVGLAWLQMSERDWSGAARSIQYATSLSPADLLILTAQAELARSRGHWTEAIALERQRSQRDPLDHSVMLMLGASNLCAANYAEAERLGQQILNNDRNHPDARALVARALLARGDTESAVATAQEEPDEPAKLSVLSDAAFKAGQRDVADATLHDLETRYGNTLPGRVGLAYAFRHQLDDAFRWLGEATRKDEPELAAALACTPEPEFTAFRSDPRIQVLRHDLGVDP